MQVPDYKSTGCNRNWEGTLRTRNLVTVALRAALLVAVVCLVVSLQGASSQAGSTTTVAVSSGTVAPGLNVIVSLTVDPAPGVTVGAVDAKISYDNSRLSVVTCEGNENGVCNPQFSPNEVAFSITSLSGLAGEIGTVTFQPITSSGSSPLDVVVTACSTEIGAPITCEAQDGAIHIAQYYPGDVDCNHIVNSIDALKILRYSAHLPVTQPDSCPSIGPTLAP
jgi:hypothetical protein